MSVTCPATLSGEYGGAYVGLVAEAGFAAISSATAGRCSSGTLRLDTTNPWVLTFQSLLGSLPSSVTGELLTFADASFLLSVTIVGITANCKYTGTLGGLLGLTGRGPYTTGLIALLATGQRYTLDSSLDTSGFCPAPETVAVKGTLGFTSTTRTQLAAMGFSVVPVIWNYGVANGERDFVFRNISGAGITITRVQLSRAGIGFTIVGNECLNNDGSAKLIAEMATCRVRVRFVSGGAGVNQKWSDIWLFRGAGGTTLTAYASLVGD